MNVLFKKLAWCFALVLFFGNFIALPTASADTKLDYSPPDAGVPAYAYVDSPNPVDRLNVRAKASADAAIVARLYRGSPVEIVRDTGAYTEIRVGKISGFVERRYLIQNVDWDYRGSLPAFKCVFGAVNLPSPSDRLPMRAAAKESAASLGGFPNGTVVQVLGTSGDYYQVRAYDKTGYMLKKHLQVDGNPGKKTLRNVVAGNIKVNSLDLRVFPDQAAPKIAALSKADPYPVYVLGTAGGWYFVQVCSPWNPALAYKGFVRGQDILVMGSWENDDGSATPPDDYYVVSNPNTEDRLNLRAAPSTNAEALGKYFTTTQVRVLSRGSDGWYKVAVDGKEGYMQGKFLEQLTYTNLASW